jgi:hypothetical protein
MPQSGSERNLVELLADDFLARHKQGDRRGVRSTPTGFCQARSGSFASDFSRKWQDRQDRHIIWRASYVYKRP